MIERLIYIVAAISIIGIAVGIFDMIRRERMIAIANVVFAILQGVVVIFLMAVTTIFALPIILLLEKFGIIEKER